MPKPRDTMLNVTIETLAVGGDGVAHVEIDGRPRAVFVPNTVPGDVVVAKVDTSKSPARGTFVRLEAAGPTRVKPPCGVHEACGGCDAMHMSEAGQVEAHRAVVESILPRSMSAVALATHEAKRTLGYRTRARVSIHVTGGRAKVGMKEGGSNRTVETDVCLVLDPRLDRARTDLAALFEGARGEGDAQLALRAKSDGSRVPVAQVRWNGELPGAVFGRLEAAVTANAFGGFSVLLPGVSRPATIGDPTPVGIGVDGAPLELGVGGFAQANDEVNAALVAHVCEAVKANLREDRTTKVVELYAGSGNITVALAALDVDLIAVESVREACDAARRNLLHRNANARARVIEARAEDYALPAATDIVVLDPPRTGAREFATRCVRSGPKRIVYVSCDPATLGRDLAALESAYEATSVATFEMFPQTSHVETVVVLDRIRGGRSKGRAP